MSWLHLSIFLAFVSVRRTDCSQRDTTGLTSSLSSILCISMTSRLSTVTVVVSWCELREVNKWSGLRQQGLDAGREDSLNANTVDSAAVSAPTFVAARRDVAPTSSSSSSVVSGMWLQRLMHGNDFLSTQWHKTSAYTAPVIHIVHHQTAQVREQDAYRQTRGAVKTVHAIPLASFSRATSPSLIVCLYPAYCRLLKLTASSNAGGFSQNTDRYLLVMASVHTCDNQSGRLPWYIGLWSVMHGTATRPSSRVHHKWYCRNAKKCNTILLVINSPGGGANAS